MAKIEYRSPINLDENKRTLSGYAAVFESTSKYIGFYETLKRGSITEDTIKKSDVVLTFEHQNDKVLARSKNGEGSLKLSVDEKGLYFECEVPNTTLGNDLYELVKRGDIYECSFAFTIPETDEAQRWYYGDDDILYRDILEIDELFDCTLAVRGCYGDTYVNARKLDYEQAINTLKRNMTEDKEQEYLDKIAELEAQIKALEEKEEKELPTDEETDKETETPAVEPEPEQEPEPEPAADEKEETEPKEEPKDEPAPEDEENKNIQRSNIMKLQKIFNRAMESGAPQEISLRAMTTVSTSGDTVKEDVKDILAPIYENGLIADLGIKVYSGLKDNQRFPLLGKVEASWLAETATQGLTPTSASTTSKYLTPHIIKAIVPVSYQMLVQDNVSFETTLVNAMTEAIQEKIIKTMFSANDPEVEGGIASAPAGLLKDATPVSMATFEKLAEAEATLEGVGFHNYKYALTPAKKAELRTMTKAETGVAMVFQNGEVDGVPAYSNFNLTKSVLGAFEHVNLGLWDTVRVEKITDSATAGTDTVNFVVTAYCDWAAIRPNCVLVEE